MDLFSTVLGVDYQDDHLHDELRADLVDLVNRPENTHVKYRPCMTQITSYGKWQKLQDTVEGLKWPFDVKKEFQKAMAHPGLSKRTCVKLHFEVVQVV